MSKQIGKFKYGKCHLVLMCYLSLLLTTFSSMVICYAFKFLLGDTPFSFFVMGVVTLLLSGSSLYGFLWNQGDKEANYIQFKHMEEEKYKGFKVGAFVMILYIALDIVLALCVFDVVNFEFLRAFRIINAPLYGFMKLVNAGLEITASEYVFMALMPFVYLLLCGFGYELGVRHISIKERLVYKQ